MFNRITLGIITSIAAVMAVASLTVGTASAHVLESNNGIGAVIHIDPDDDPIAGENSTFYFEFKDTNNKLALADCDCKVTIKQGDKVIGTEKIKAIRQLSGSINYTLPQKDVYTIDVSGRPLRQDAFATFQFSYSFRVERGVDAQAVAAPAEKPKNNLFITASVVLSGLLVFGLIATIVYNVKYKSNAKPAEPAHVAKPSSKTKKT